MEDHNLNSGQFLYSEDSLPGKKNQPDRSQLVTQISKLSVDSRKTNIKQQGDIKERTMPCKTQNIT